MLKKTVFHYALYIFVFMFCIAAHPFGLGVNISLPERGGTFVDVVKEHFRWLDPNSWAPIDEVDFDEQGWPLRNALFLMDERPVAEWVGEIDDPEAHRIDWGGTYLGRFTGKALVQSRGEGQIRNVHYDEGGNTTTFELVVDEPDGDGYGFFAISFLETQRTADDFWDSGLTDFELLRPGYDPAAEQIFMDEFIEALTTPHFVAIRYKDFTGTDGADPDFPDVMEWADRKLPTDASQERIPAIYKNSGAAWEYVIELANLTHIDPWINIPVSATSEYVTQLAMMFKENLDPDLNIYVESSNEVWNTAPGYEQTQYSKDQAAALGIDERANHARRTIELAQLFEGVFGEGSLNNRIRVILCSHAPMLKWWVQPMIDYIKTTFGEPNQYIYALACQSYYSGGADAGESVDKILADCRASIDGQINEPSGNQAGRKQWIAKAAELGLPGGFCSYEGGPDHGGGSTTNIDNRIDAERSPGMADVFKYNIDDGFFQLGGNLAIQFTLTSAYTRYGCWGLTDDITDPDRNYKFQAARDLITASGVRSRAEIGGYVLAQNYPNPFNPRTTIEFSLPVKTHVELAVYNVLGNKVTELKSEIMPAGEHRIDFDASFLPSGVYLYTLKTSEQTSTKKLMLMK